MQFLEKILSVKTDLCMFISYLGNQSLFHVSKVSFKVKIFKETGPVS